MWMESVAWAQGAGGGGNGTGPGGLLSLVPFVLIFVIFYFLLIRPQQKKQKEQKTLLDALKKGDKVVTTSGIWGTITNLGKETVTLQIADNTKIKSVDVVLGNGEKLAAHYGGHGMPPTDFFWSLFWTVPQNFPTGSLGYKVNATMNDGTVVTWEPFNRATTQLMVIAGEPPMAPPRQ